MKKENLILGILLIGIGFFLSVDSVRLYYYYNYTDILFFFMYPTYELCARFVLGLLLILAGILILLGRKSGFKVLFNIALGMIVYGVFRFIINYEYWIEEIFAGLLYVFVGLIFIGIVKRNKLKLINEQKEN